MFRKVDGSSSGGVDNNACNRAALGRRQRGFSVIHLLCGTNCDAIFFYLYIPKGVLKEEWWQAMDALRVQVSYSHYYRIKTKISLFLDFQD